jgi:hypothetical protein
VASGATLAFNSEVETNWSQEATSSTYEVGASSLTSKSLTVTSNAGGTLRIVFTDKNDSARKATLNVVVAPREFERVPVIEGEVRETEAAVSLLGGQQFDFLTRFRVALDGADGLYSEEISDISPTSPSSEPYTFMHRDAEDRRVGSSSASGTTCSYSVPVVDVSYPMHVGKVWSGETVRTCSGTVSFEMTAQSVVEAYESITVDAGTFDTLRIKTENAFTNSDNPRIPGGAYSATRTCWWAVDIGREVKCEASYVYPTGTADGVTLEFTESLTKYAR